MQHRHYWQLDLGVETLCVASLLEVRSGFLWTDLSHGCSIRKKVSLLHEDAACAEVCAVQTWRIVDGCYARVPD